MWRDARVPGDRTSLHPGARSRTLECCHVDAWRRIRQATGQPALPQIPCRPALAHILQLAMPRPPVPTGDPGPSTLLRSRNDDRRPVRREAGGTQKADSCMQVRRISHVCTIPSVAICDRDGRHQAVRDAATAQVTVTAYQNPIRAARSNSSVQQDVSLGQVMTKVPPSQDL